jgi:hypothetical protein
MPVAWHLAVLRRNKSIERGRINDRLKGTRVLVSRRRGRHRRGHRGCLTGPGTSSPWRTALEDALALATSCRSTAAIVDLGLPAGRLHLIHAHCATVARLAVVVSNRRAAR